MRGSSEAQRRSLPRTRGARKPRMTSQAVSGVSELKKGPSEVVTSAQPVTPSARSSTRTTVRSRVMPKLVSKGALRRILSLRRVIASMCMDSQGVPESACNECCNLEPLTLATIGGRHGYVKRSDIILSFDASERNWREGRLDQSL